MELGQTFRSPRGAGGVRRTLLTLAACFGLGLGLAPMIRSAHACSCIESAEWRLERVELTGDGDVEVEAQRWPTAAWLSRTADSSASNGERVELRAPQGLELELERVQ